MVLRNRMVLPAMDQNTCDEHGLLTERNFDHYEQRAIGGVGLAILETSAVSYPFGATSRHQPSLSTDDCVPGLRTLAERVHAHGTKLLVQICHHGKTAGVDIAEGRPVLMPSVPAPTTNGAGMIVDLTIPEMIKLGARVNNKRPTFVEATADDLAVIVKAFADAARRVEEAGCDGVEVHAAHGYLISTFLSPFWNRRTDEYGASTNGRTRLLREVVQAIRGATSARFVVTVRLDGNEFGVEGGITPELAVFHAVAAEEAGADAVHVSAMADPNSGPGFTDGPLPWLPGQYRAMAAQVKRSVSVPVIAVGRLLPDEAESVLNDGDADFVAMGRQLLADPDLPARLAAGTPDLVRPCINCFVCVAENFWDAAPVCAVNARLGRPQALPLTVRTKSPRHYVVIGGGPGGMEAARVAAARGHRVTLLEKSKHLGGTARFSSLTTPMNGAFVSYLEASLAQLRVDVRLQTTADVDTVRALSPDVVIVATGAKRVRPDVPGADLEHVLTGDDLRALLTGDDPEAAKKLSFAARLAVKAGQTVGVTDDLDRVRTLSKRWMPLDDDVVVVGGGLVGVELAEFLAERGRRVTVLEESKNLGVEMAHPRRWRALHEARSHGVNFITEAKLVEISASEVSYEKDGATSAVRAGNVILATGVMADSSLADSLTGAGFEVRCIGDADSVGYIQGAVRSGFDAASLDL